MVMVDNQTNAECRIETMHLSQKKDITLDRYN